LAKVELIGCAQILLFSKPPSAGAKGTGSDGVETDRTRRPRRRKPANCDSDLGLAPPTKIDEITACSRYGAATIIDGAGARHPRQNELERPSLRARTWQRSRDGWSAAQRGRPSDSRDTGRGGRKAADQLPGNGRVMISTAPLVQCFYAFLDLFYSPRGRQDDHIPDPNTWKIMRMIKFSSLIGGAGIAVSFANETVFDHGPEQKPVVASKLSPGACARTKSASLKKRRSMRPHR
jgi:hypothetical protein